MNDVSIVPATPADIPAVTGVVTALESSLYPHAAGSFSEEDLADEWAGFALGLSTYVVRDSERVVGYGALRDRGELWRAEGYVDPAAHGRGIGTLLATTFERDAAERGARRIQNGVYEVDAAARGLMESLGYREVRVFREMRIALSERPPEPAWPDGLRVDPFDPERDAHAFHAAQQEAFADHWEYVPRAFDSWAKAHLESERFDPALWCVLRDGDEIAAGSISTGNTYGGGFVQILFTRRPWRKQGIGLALVADTFCRLWDAGERSVGLGVDAQSGSGAFRLYERAGMTPELGWVQYEKELTSNPDG